MSRGVVGQLKETGSHLDIEWEIPDYLSLAGSAGECYDSPAYSFAGSSWYMCVYPWGRYRRTHVEQDLESLVSRNPRDAFHPCSPCGGESSERIAVYVGRGDSGPEVTASVGLYLKTKSGRRDVLRERRHAFQEKDCQLGDSVSSNRFRMVFFPEDSEVLISGSLVVLCTMRFDGERGIQESAPATPEKKFVCDYKQLLLSGDGCDVTFLVQGQKFQAHRIILGARSPVFAAMLGHDMKEKNTGRIDIDDCDPDTFPDFLRFLYCGSVDSITSQNVRSLYTAADKYDVQDLKSECLAFMGRHLDVDNFCDVLRLALRHDEAKLERQAKDFFAMYKLKIVKSVQWQVFVAENETQGRLMMSAIGPVLGQMSQKF